MTDERVAGHLRLEKSGRTDENGVRAQIRGAFRGSNGRMRRLTPGARDERPAVWHRLTGGSDDQV